VDGAATVWVAFTRWPCGEEGGADIYLTMNAGGSWVDPVQVSAQSYGPSFAVRDGVVHVAYVAGRVMSLDDGYPIWYATGRLDDLMFTQLANAGRGAALALDASGLVRFAYLTDKVMFAQQTSGGAFGEPEVAADAQAVRLQLAWDPVGGNAFLAFTSSGRAPMDTAVTERAESGWSPSRLALPDAYLTGLGVYDGIAQLIGSSTLGDGPYALQYSSNPDGPFAPRELAAGDGQGSAMTVDATGRAHVVFLDADTGEAGGLWYLVGPNG
jgi:hypothetical protein